MGVFGTFDSRGYYIAFQVTPYDGVLCDIVGDGHGEVILLVARAGTLSPPETSPHPRCSTSTTANVPGDL